MKLDKNESNFKFGSIILLTDTFIQLLDYCNEEDRIKELNFTYKMPLSGFDKVLNPMLHTGYYGNHMFERSSGPIYICNNLAIISVR